MKPKGNKKPLSPYQKIVRAWKRGTGVRLSNRDVRNMMLDQAILEACENDNEDPNFGDVGDPR